MLWIKAFHLIAAISWFVGLLYLPRLLVYHAAATPNTPVDETFKIMERRLLKIIMTPAMLASWIFGLWLILLFGSFPIWLWIKLACVVGLTIFHFYIARCVKAFAMGKNAHSARFFRFINEIASVFLVLIIFMAILRPF